LRETTQETLEGPNRNPYLFIVGCARSGTTLLQRIVDAHPDVAIIHEMHWVTGYLKSRKVRKPEDPVTPELVTGLLENHRFARLRIRREDFEEMFGSGEPIPYAEFLTGIFDLYGEEAGKPLVGNKTPAYVRHLPELHALWPYSRFVHLIRDGRDVYLSVMNWNRAEAALGRYITWPEDPVSTTALWWKRKVLLGQEGGRSLGRSLYHESRYESLIAQPADECAALCSFLDLPYDAGMLRFDEGRETTDPIDPDHPWMPITRGLRSWRLQMPEAEVETFEAAAGDLLEELGYQRAFPRPSPRARELAARLHHLFTEDLLSRESQLPKHWQA
jgi:Sulfotransferase family